MSMEHASAPIETWRGDAPEAWVAATCIAGDVSLTGGMTVVGTAALVSLGCSGVGAGMEGGKGGGGVRILVFEICAQSVNEQNRAWFCTQNILAVGAAVWVGGTRLVVLGGMVTFRKIFPRIGMPTT